MPVQNISYFMQVRMKLCQSKQVDLLFSESLLRILTPKSAALTSIPLLPSLLSPFFSYQIIHEVGGSDPWKIFFIRACYALCIKAGRNYDKRTNRRTFDPINRCPGVTTNNDPRRIMTGGSLFYVEKWPPFIILRRKMTPSRRIMSPIRRINTRGVFIQRVGYRKMTPIE